MAAYVTVYQTTMYVRGFEGIFHIYLALYAEKPSISMWAMAPILEWPRSPNTPWNLTKFASKWKSIAWVSTWKKR